MTISVLSNYPSTHSSGGRGAVRCDGDHHLMVWKARRPGVDGAVIPMPWTTFVWHRQRTHSIRRRLAEKDQWRKKRLENGVWRAESSLGCEPWRRKKRLGVRRPGGWECGEPRSDSGERSSQPRPSSVAWRVCLAFLGYLGCCPWRASVCTRP